MKDHCKYILLLLAMLPIGLWAQDVSFVASAKPTVEVGEQFRIVYELNAEGSRFTGPDLASVNVLTGPMTSSSSSIQIINGQMARSFTQTYTYIVMASAQGELTINPASVFVDGKKIQSNKLTIRVVASSGGNNSGSSSQQSQSDNAGQQSVSDKDVYIRAIADKSSIYLGEQVIVTYRIFTRIPISNISVNKLSSFPGFWMKNLLDENATMQQSRQVINGEEYVVADLRKMALFPQKTGKLRIEPMEIECTAQVRTQGDRRRSRDPFESFFNDPFFNRNIANVEKTLASGTLSIDVKPLPPKGKPASFNGAIGQFSLQSAIDKTDLKSNEAVTVTYVVSGTGNIELLEFPKPAFPADFEVYEPKITDQVKTAPSGISGSRKIEYLAIPRQAGNFTIPPLSFSYFDPKTEEYHTLSSEGFELKVSKGNDESAGTVISSGNQESIRMLGSDIRHIKTKAIQLRKANDFFFGSATYITLILLSLISFGMFLYVVRKQTRLHQNQQLMRNRKATKIARKRLVEAQQHLKQNNQNEFYTEMSQAIWGYIADKFSIPRSELSIENVRETLTDRQTSESLIDAFVETLTNCEFARFAPGDPGRKMEELYKQGIEIITNAEKMLK